MDDVRALSYSQCEQRARVMHARLVTLAAKHRLSRADEQEAEQLTAEVSAIDDRRRSLERADDLARGGGGTRIRYEGERDGIDPYRHERDESHDPHRGTRDKAMRVLDRHVNSGALPAGSAEVLENQILKTGSGMEQDWSARMMSALGGDAYLRAFAKHVANPTQGHLRWTAQESEAFREVEGLRSETRAGTTVDTQGGFFIPLTLDPTALLTSAGSTNPLRQIARTVMCLTDEWRGITSQGIVGEWLGEGSEAHDASPTFGQPTIPVFKSSEWIQWSYEVGQDGLDFVGQLGLLLSDGWTQLTNTAFTTGSGIQQPTGIITSLSAGSAPSVVNSITNGALVIADVFALQSALPPRFQEKANWTANLAVLNLLRQMQTANGSLIFPSLNNDPQRFWGGPCTNYRICSRPSPAAPTIFTCCCMGILGSS